MKIRLIWHECTATVDRRRLTKEDIDNDIHLEEFKSKEELLNFLMDILGFEEDILDFGDTVDEQIDEIVSILSDPGDGSPTILFLSIDNNVIEDLLGDFGIDGFTCTLDEVKETLKEYKDFEDDESPWYDDEEYSEELEEDIQENNDQDSLSDDQITAELLDCLDVLDSESLTPAPEEKPEWEKKKEDVLEYYNKVKTWHTDPKVKTASEYNIDVERLNEWLGEGENDMKIEKQDSKLLNEDGEQDKTLKAAVDSAEKVLDNPEVYSGEGDIEKALDTGADRIDAIVSLPASRLLG